MPRRRLLSTRLPEPLFLCIQGCRATWALRTILLKYCKANTSSGPQKRARRAMQGDASLGLYPKSPIPIAVSNHNALLHLYPLSSMGKVIGVFLCLNGQESPEQGHCFVLSLFSSANSHSSSKKPTNYVACNIGNSHPLRSFLLGQQKLHPF